MFGHKSIGTPQEWEATRSQSDQYFLRVRSLRQRIEQLPAEQQAAFQTYCHSLGANGYDDDTIRDRINRTLGVGIPDGASDDVFLPIALATLERLEAWRA